MSGLSKVLNSSVGRKAVMAVTGLFLCVFLLEHLYTNLLLFYGDGGVAFNEASHSMVHSIFIRIVEVVLFAAILIHAFQALALTRSNAAARPIKYVVSRTDETSTWMSRNMGLTGSIIFFFIVVHIYHFFTPYRITHTVGGVNQETLAYEVMEGFENPIYAILYLVSVILLAVHISHGFQSAFQTLGLNSKNYAGLLRKGGYIFAIVVGIGFALFPIIFFLGHQMGWDVLNWNH
jgi:succinate dehydrogenase / fumarate reductase cytochrome b subunit